MFDKVQSSRMTRRSLLSGLGVALAHPLLAACQQAPAAAPTPQVVTQVVTQVVETQVPVTQVVEKQVPVTQVVTQVVEKQVTTIVTAQAASGPRKMNATL